MAEQREDVLVYMQRVADRLKAAGRTDFATTVIRQMNVRAAERQRRTVKESQ